MSRSGLELAEDFSRSIYRSGDLVLIVDMGGDILMRLPYPITARNQEIHPERYIRSPNTDAVCLDFAQYLFLMGIDSMVGIAAMGGDGELGEIGLFYLSELNTAKEIVSMLDLIDFIDVYREEISYELDWIERLLTCINSEVSGNLLKRLFPINSFDVLAKSSFEKLKIDILKENLTLFKKADIFKHIPGPEVYIRSGTRKEFLSPAYFRMFFLYPRSITNRIQTNQLRMGRFLLNYGILNWWGKDIFHQNLGYITELTDVNNLKVGVGRF